MSVSLVFHTNIGFTRQILFGFSFNIDSTQNASAMNNSEWKEMAIQTIREQNNEQTPQLKSPVYKQYKLLIKYVETHSCPTKYNISNEM